MVPGLDLPDPDLLVRLAAVAEHTGLPIAALHTVDGLCCALLLERAEQGRHAMALDRYELLRDMGADPSLVVEAAQKVATLAAPRNYGLDDIADRLGYGWDRIDLAVPRFTADGSLVFTEAVNDDA